jgi:hypothetical protein
MKSYNDFLRENEEKPSHVHEIEKDLKTLSLKIDVAIKTGDEMTLDLIAMWLRKETEKVDLDYTNKLDKE